MENFDDLHSKALQIVTRYKKTEAELLDVLQEIDRSKGYLKLGYTSLFMYCVKALGLTESVTSNFITVSRKAIKVPELKIAIKSGELTVSKARKITSVVTSENQREWISKAQDLSSRALEKEVARVRHQINLRDQGQCSKENCKQQRWIDIHHIIPISRGGQNTLENLKTLCSAHHRMEHETQ